MLGTSKSIWGFDPRSILGCQLWLDGRDTSSMTFSGSTITQWNDKSGNGYNATIAPNRVGATYSTAYNAVNFASSTTGYITNYSAAPTNETMFVVGNNPSPSGANNIIIGGVSGARSLGLGYSNPNGTGTIGNLNTQVAWLASVGGYTSGTTALVRSQFTPSSNSVAFNGGSPATGGAPGFTAGRVTYLGVDATDGYYHYNGYMMEALFYNRILTTTEIQQVEGYLAHKWGLTTLPSTHPFKPFPPHLRVFQPNDVTGCSLWLDAADSSTITGTTSVTAWRDKSGNGNNAVFTGTNPSYTPANKYVETSNLNQEFSVPGTIFNTVGGSLFIVYADKQQNTQNGMLYAISSGYTPHLFDQCLFRADGYSYALGGVDLPGNTFKTALNTKNTLLYSINYVHNTVNYTVTVNGTVFPFTSSGVVVPSGSLVFSGGWGGAANIKFNEIIFFNSVLTTSQRQQIEWYLANKWGIFSTSPVSTPLTISGSGIWLDGADTSSMTFSSGAITQWRDKSGSSNHFGLTRGTATSILDNGRNVVNFGEATVMTSTNSISFTTSSAFFIVSKMTSTNGAQDLLGFPSFGNGFALRFFSSILYSGNSDDLSLGNYYVNGNFNPSYPSTTYYNTYSLISTLVPSRGGTTVISLSDNWLLEGHAQRFFIGNIAEFIFYPGGVTNIQRQKIEGYLANKWGLTLPAPTVHPYDKYPPASLDNTPISATGGTITTSGSYKIHTFTTVGTTTFTLTSSVSISAEVLVVAGGGGGGYDDGGGGGAGGVIYSQSFTISSGSYTITLGDGGTSGTSGGVDGGNGGNTTFSSLTAIGGGGGATSDRNGKNGGSGGGVGWGASTPGTGTAGQGNAGGGGTSGPNYCAGGGGGAGGVGGTGAGTLPGNGGIGVSYTIAGTTYSVGGGGGGGLAVQNPGNIRSTASHGGGNGAGHGSVAPGSGSPNTGGGGGGGNNEQATNGGTGGSGIVIIAYKT